MAWGVAGIILWVRRKDVISKGMEIDMDLILNHYGRHGVCLDAVRLDAGGSQLIAAGNMKKNVMPCGILDNDIGRNRSAYLVGNGNWDDFAGVPLFAGGFCGVCMISHLSGIGREWAWNFRATVWP